MCMGEIMSGESPMEWLHDLQDQHPLIRVHAGLEFDRRCARVAKADQLHLRVGARRRPVRPAGAERDDPQRLGPGFGGEAPGMEGEVPPPGEREQDQEPARMTKVAGGCRGSLRRTTLKPTT